MNNAQKKVLREQYRNAAHGEYRRESDRALKAVPVTKAEVTAKKLLARLDKKRRAVSEAYRKRTNELHEQFSFAIEFKEVNECLAIIKKRRTLQ